MEQSSLQEGKAEAWLLEELAKAMEKKMNERLHVSNSLSWKFKKKKYFWIGDIIQSKGS